MIGELLTNKDSAERAVIKSRELSKLDFRGRYVDHSYGVQVETLSVRDIVGGIEVKARGYKNGKQLGFGDGSIDIERFRIYNPPILVDDINGNIFKGGNNSRGEAYMRKLRENPVLSVQETLAHNIKSFGIEGSNIIKGRVGNTSSTFFPDAHVESTSVDGTTARAVSSEAFATIRAGAGTTSDDSSANNTGALIRASTTTDEYAFIFRPIFVLDSSALPDGDDINSAIFSIKASGHTSDFGGGFSLVRCPTGITTAIANENYNVGNWDMTKQADTDITASGWDDSNYNDWTLNATGLANISKTSLTFLGVVVSFDQGNSAPTWGSGDDTQFDPLISADTSGTSSDPKLVVDHGTSGPANLKTLDTVAVANIKTINGVAIASVKTINTVA